MRHLAGIFVALAATLGTAAGVCAQTVAATSGQYTTADGRYTITVETSPEGLVVIEPNKRSVYTAVSAGTYHFTNPTNQIQYGIRVVSTTELEAFKPGANGPGTQRPGTPLRLRTAAQPSSETNEQYTEMAERYAELARTDPNNVHVWAACGAVALARGTYNREGFEAYAREAVALLKPIMVDPSSNPCRDVIPSSIWNPVR